MIIDTIEVKIREKGQRENWGNLPIIVTGLDINKTLDWTKRMFVYKEIR